MTVSHRVSYVYSNPADNFHHSEMKNKRLSERIESIRCIRTLKTVALRKEERVSKPVHESFTFQAARLHDKLQTPLARWLDGNQLIFRSPVWGDWRWPDRTVTGRFCRRRYGGGGMKITPAPQAKLVGDPDRHVEPTSRHALLFQGEARGGGGGVKEKNRMRTVHGGRI